MSKVISIKKVGVSKQKCLQVSSDDGLFVLSNGIVTHNSDEKIWKFVSKIRGRITSRMKGNYYGRFILDSSPNSLEDPITQWAFEEAPKSKMNYCVIGSRWHFYPEDFPKFKILQEDGTYTENHDFSAAFAVFKGGNGKIPAVIEYEDQLQAYDTVDILWCPRESITSSGTESYIDMAKENPVEFIKDYCGIPSNIADRIFYMPETIENCFDNNLKGFYATIDAPAIEEPEHLIWKQVEPIFFYKVFNQYKYYYNPDVPRVLSVDGSESKDMASITISHSAFNPDVLDQFTKQPQIEYVTDMIIVINPKGGLVNLDAIKFFIMDLRNIGNMNIKRVSFDGFEAKPTRQYLMRQGISVDYVSVDRDTKYYLTYIDLVFKGRWHGPKNIITKNNMKSLIMSKRKSGSSKVDHINGDLVYDYTGDWNTDKTGIFAKDSTDAIAANIALLELYSNEFPPIVKWSADESCGRNVDTVKSSNDILMKKMNLSF